MEKNPNQSRNVNTHTHPVAEHNQRVWFSREDPREGGGPRTRSARVPRACQRQHQRELSCCWRPFQPGPGDFCSSSAWCVNCGKLKIGTDQSKSFDIFSTFPRWSKFFILIFVFFPKVEHGARCGVHASDSAPFLPTVILRHVTSF